MKALVYRGPGKKAWEDVPSPQIRRPTDAIMGLVNTNTTPMLLRLVAEGRLDVDQFASHHFKLGDMLAAYETFGRAAETRALKVVIER